ncbi:MAG TPA: outer membrane beta-barrel protein [Bacteroidales bacterium]|nr:outer membrane beta-barrel protein [Bacteroidales bacterium]
MKALIGLLLLTGLFVISLNNLAAQVSIMGGGNYCDIRHNHILEGEKAIITYHFGVSVCYYPIKSLPDFAIQNELLFNRKGYKQDPDKSYLFHFNYISFPVLLKYSLFENLSIQAGVEVSQLFYTNIKQGTKTYNNTDIGIILGFGCFETKTVNFYSRFTYGLLPMIDYYSFDKIGNFTGKVHDLKNICMSVGLKINIYNEKIRLYN